jgi:hypothetical protein
MPLVPSGIQVAPNAPAVNQFFSNDKLLFVKANEEGARDVSVLLNKYCEASGKRLNFDNSLFFFSKFFNET